VNRTVHAFLLVFAFLFAQAGAAMHMAGHIAAATHSGDKGLPSDTACQLCVGYAQISGAAPLPAQAAVPACLASYQLPQAAPTLLFNQTFFYTRARAPPALPQRLA
jgi:hypothetical protein